MKTKLIVISLFLLIAVSAFGQSYGTYRDTGGGIYSTQPWCNENTQMGGGGCAKFGGEVITFSATPVFNCANGLVHKITLTGNVTSSTLINCLPQQPIILQICQDATGSRTLVYPSNMTGATTIGSTASKCTLQQFNYDPVAGNAYALGAASTNQ